MNSNLRKINYLIGFHWVFIKNNPLIWILTIIGSLIQLLLIVIFNLLGLQLSNFALLIFLVPNIIYSIFIIVMNYALIQVNKDNSLDDRLLCSEFNKYQIKLARFILNWIFLGSMIIISDLGLFYFVITEQVMFGLATFISNTFITPFILLLISIIFTYIAIKTPKGSYIVLTILITLISFGLSLITRVFIPKPIIDSNNYYKLIQKDSQYLVEKTKSDVNLNQIIETNTFIPSEWFYSFYSVVFSMTNSESNSDFAIRRNKLKSYDYESILKNIPIMIREQDINFLCLSNKDYENLICKDIKIIVKKYNLDTNDLLLNQIIDTISKSVDWNYTPNIMVSNALLDLTGINTEFNQLYYLIKYNKSLNIDLNVLVNVVQNRFSENIAKLFKTLIESENTFYNLFKSDNEFNSLSKYPNEYVVDTQKPIVIDDLDFIKTKLIQFIDNSVYYLNSNGLLVLFDISVLQEYNQSIKDKQTYYSFVNGIAQSYKDTNDYLSFLNLNNNLSSIMKYSLSNNYLNLRSIYNFYKYESFANINYSEMVVSLISFINIVSSILFFVHFKEKQYA